MELYEIRQGVSDSSERLKQLGESLDRSQKSLQIAELEERPYGGIFWDDPKSAQKVIRQ